MGFIYKREINKTIKIISDLPEEDKQKRPEKQSGNENKIFCFTVQAQKCLRLASDKEQR